MLGLAGAFACLFAAEPLPLSLQEVGRRRPPDLIPVHLDEKVIVQGVVSVTAFHFPEYNTLAIQDETGAATSLKVAASDNRLDAFHPGDEIKVEGTVSFTAGTVTILPGTIQVLGQKSPPVPLDIPIQDLQDPRYQSRLVHTSARVKQVGDTIAGGQLVTDGLLTVFLPRPYGRATPNFNGYNPGDAIQLTGVAHQYCTHAPYTSGFEILLNDPAQIVRAGRPWLISPWALASGLTLVLLTAFLLWSRERRLRNQRERLRRTYQLGEEVLGAASAAAILQRIGEALPGILQVSRVHLYVHNRSARTLDGVTDEPAEPVSISLSSPPAGTQAGAVACFHYRTLLVIPDIDRSPFPIAGKPGDNAPKSLLFVPMLAQGEVIGVLELDQDDRVRDFTPDEQALAQHLGNQIGVAIRLLDQRSVQEQLSRTEKLAAVGRLISGVVNELQTPLASISDLANRALEKSRLSPAEREVAAIAAEARKAAAMVARLVSFAAAEQVEARQVSVGSLLTNLIDFREGDWKASGIRVRNLTSREPLYVLGSQGQLEQVFLNLLVHAEQSLAETPQKVITIRTSVLAKRLLVEISFTAPAGLRKPEEAAAVLGVTRSVVAGHGGEVRLIDKGNADPCFEVELPISMKDRSAPSAAGPAVEFSRRMTALVIEPDEAAQRQILALLSARGYRVVPVANSDNGLELAQRMRFDAAFCSVHAHGLNWVELSECMHSRVGGFILLSDGYDAELAADFEGDGRFVLAKPVQEGELERVLRTIDRLASAKVVPIVKNGVA
jgi:GAF domain-containing protein